MTDLLASEPVWMREDAVRAIHARQIAEHGGWVAVADAAMLSGILQRPKNLFHPHGFTFAELAACYAYGIGVHRPFCDGNIRTAWLVMRTFLACNGWKLDVLSAARYQLMKALAAGELSESHVAAWLSSVAHPREVLAQRAANAYT